MDPKGKKFLKLPRLDGGKKLLKQFIRQHLRYPEEALNNKIEGDVIVKYKVTGKGEVTNPEIVKGLGYGCDQEAIRLVNMLQYEPVKNRGLRIVTDNRIKIPFRMEQAKARPGVSFEYVPKQKEKPAANKKEGGQTRKDSGVSYTYSIRWSDQAE